MPERQSTDYRLSAINVCQFWGFLPRFHSHRHKPHGFPSPLRVYWPQGSSGYLGLPQVRCVFRLDSGSMTLDVPPSEVSRWRAVARVLRSPLDAFSCALLPDLCSLCGSPLPQLSSVPICDFCWTEFPVLLEPSCALCGDALTAPSSSVSGLCRPCRMAPPPFVRAVAYGIYQSRMREALHAFKYDGLHPVARPLGKMLAQAIAKLALEAPIEMLVVPVPLHRSKLAKRGFNQARQLSLHALKFLRKSHPAWKLTLASTTLMRLRETESQAGLTPRERRINVRGAFSVSTPGAVTAKHILLIDDISPPAQPRGLLRKSSSAPERPRFGSLLWRARAASIRGFLTSSRKARGTTSAPSRSMLQQPCRQVTPLHRTTNHLFLRGDKGCRWEKL